MIKIEKIDLVYAESGDWVGIYVNDKLIAENHSYQEDDLLHILKIPCDTHWIDMGDKSRLPEDLSVIYLAEITHTRMI